MAVSDNSEAKWSELSQKGGFSDKLLGKRTMEQVWERRIQNAKDLLQKDSFMLEEIEIKKGPTIREGAGQLWIW